ncbi:unnamed protein product [Amoebophrya sp. A120]|nr:unnamed protein product [Amoebophrya sp. A120]|eukprot:GSA120T00026067001.1
MIQKRDLFLCLFAPLGFFAKRTLAESSSGVEPLQIHGFNAELDGLPDIAPFADRIFEDYRWAMDLPDATLKPIIRLMENNIQVLAAQESYNSGKSGWSDFVVNGEAIHTRLSGFVKFFNQKLEALSNKLTDEEREIVKHPLDEDEVDGLKPNSLPPAVGLESKRVEVSEKVAKFLVELDDQLVEEKYALLREDVNNWMTQARYEQQTRRQADSSPRIHGFNAELDGLPDIAFADRIIGVHLNYYYTIIQPIDTLEMIKQRMENSIEMARSYINSEESEWRKLVDEGEAIHERLSEFVVFFREMLKTFSEGLTKKETEVVDYFLDGFMTPPEDLESRKVALSEKVAKFLAQLDAQLVENRYATLRTNVNDWLTRAYVMYEQQESQIVSSPMKTEGRSEMPDVKRERAGQSKTTASGRLSWVSQQVLRPGRRLVSSFFPQRRSSFLQEEREQEPILEEHASADEQPPRMPGTAVQPADVQGDEGEINEQMRGRTEKQEPMQKERHLLPAEVSSKSGCLGDQQTDSPSCTRQIDEAASSDFSLKMIMNGYEYYLGGAADALSGIKRHLDWAAVFFCFLLLAVVATLASVVLSYLLKWRKTDVKSPAEQKSRPVVVSNKCACGRDAVTSAESSRTENQKEQGSRSSANRNLQLALETRAVVYNAEKRAEFSSSASESEECQSRRPMLHYPESLAGECDEKLRKKSHSGRD